MNEEFAISLKTILDQSSINLVKQQLQGLRKTVGEQIVQATMPAGRAQDALGLGKSVVHAKEIELLLTKIADLETELSAKDVLGLSSREILEIETEIERLNNKIESLSKGKGLSLVQKTTVKIKNDFKSIRKSALRFVGALIGARGIYTGIRKAMGAYLAQNEELQNKLNASWYALGSLFAPVLEKIINMFTYLVSLVDAFVKSLGFAGVNMDKYGKSASKANKATAGFDELNNISSNNGAGSDFNLSPVSQDSLNNFKSILGIVSAIGAGLLAWKVSPLIASLFGQTLTPEKMGAVGLAIGGVVLAISSLLNYLNDPSWLNFGGIIAGIGTAIWGVGLFIGSTTLIVSGAITTVLGLLGMFWPQISQFLDKVVAGIDSALNWINTNITTKFGIFGGLIGGLMELAVGLLSDAIKTIQNFLDGLFRGVKDIIDGIIKIFRGDLKGGIQQVLRGIVSIIGTVLSTIVNTVSNIFSRILKFVGNLFTSISNTVSSKVKSIINNYIIQPINRVLNWLNDKLNFSYGGLNILGAQIIPSFDVRLGNFSQIPLLDVGTNYVPNDMIAMVHEGEAVVPKEFNSQEYFNNEETNDLLRQLINVVDSKEFRTYISQNDIGKSAVNYINNQSRIRGGSLV